MSAAPEDRNEGHVPSPPRDEPGGVEHARNDENVGTASSVETVVSSVEPAEQDRRNGNVTGDEEDNGGHNASNSEATESDAKDAAQWLPPPRRHQNTPASLEPSGVTNGVPGPSMSSRSPTPSTASEASGQPSLSNLVNGNGVEHHEEDENDEEAEGDEGGEDDESDGAASEASSSTSGSPRSPRSPSSGGSPSPDPQNPPNQDNGHDQDDDPGDRHGDQAENAGGGNTSQAGDAESRGSPGPSASPNNPPRSATNPNSQGHTEQQTNFGGSSLGTATNGDSNAVTALSTVGRDGLQSQLQEPGQSTSRSTQSSRPDPPSQTSAVSGPALPPIQASQPLSPLSSMNPTAPSFIPQPEQPGMSRDFALPKWQPDAEAPKCPICDVRFGMFLRKHHCRKCGRVVCDRCSPHRITIPHPYIVRPPGDLGPIFQHSYPGVEGSIADFTTIGGGERVRLCNPCVPDPNTSPPQAQQSPRPAVTDGRSLQARPPSNSFGNYSAIPGPSLHRAQIPPYDHNPSRTRSVSTSGGQGRQYFPFIPYTSTSDQYPPPNSAYFSHLPQHARHMSSTMPRSQTHADYFPPSSSFSALNRPLPRIPIPEPEIPDEDTCPVCHLELPSRALSNWEALRETHINNCITSHSNYGGSQTVATVGSVNHGTPPPRTTRRTRMFPYTATEKDCVNDAECTICLEEFEVGDQMARLECFCRFHRTCIDSWFVNHPGRCPIHQHDSFGY
ncbi:hypothetical protein F5Y14DRAFT_314670 [Nemania sp. NC0429]|nr:hypothetical protein F5Y14DRAFT_314670 [Nemania sp. NC0429]